MKYVVPVLETVLVILGGLVSILMAPIALLLACGFLIMTAILSAQMRGDHETQHRLWQWSSAGDDRQLRVGA